MHINCDSSAVFISTETFKMRKSYIRPGIEESF